ncbi:MAG TPA: glycosyltransferase family 4 protein, partial [Tissierellia bacterium]|nr:glycosyltransferase family 4 protein [Tissierellia bacterium]
MKKNIWIMNHYAHGTFFSKGGRHYWFAKYLLKNNYSPTIFCANTRHNNRSIVEIKKGKHEIKTTEGIPYVFVKTIPYKGNGVQRIMNMWLFYRNLFPVTRECAKIYGKPDVILASSVHPLTLVAGIKIAKKFGVPCICEVRDLWPESLVAYDVLKKSNPLLKLLYAGEKWIYKNADKIIFTMEGGKDYIIEKGWDKQHGGLIDLNKVYHINNGVDLEIFDYNRDNYVLEDVDLNSEETFKVIYTGSIRKANNLEIIINTAEYLQKKHTNNIKFLLYGDGDERKILENKCKHEN